MPRSRPPQAGEINSELPFVRHRYILGEAERDRHSGWEWTEFNSTGSVDRLMGMHMWAYDLTVVPSAA